MSAFFFLALLIKLQMAPSLSPTLALLCDKEKQKGNANRATLAVARKLVAYLMAVDRGQTHFLVVDREACRVVPLADWARERELAMLPLISFETGRKHKLNLLTKITR